MNPPQEPHRVLVIDDAPAIHEDFRKILRSASPPTSTLLDARARLFGGETAESTRVGFEIDCASQGREGLERVEQALASNRPYALAFVDMRMPPGWDGIETIRHLWRADPHLQVVICTAYSDHTWEDTIRALGDTDSLLILKKPFDNIEALQLAHALTKKWSIARRDRETMANLDERVRQRTAELRDSEERFAKIFHANPSPTALQRRSDGRYLDANPAFLALIGHPREAVIERTATELGLWPSEDVWAQALASLESRSPLRAHRARLRTREDKLRDVLVSVEHTEFGSQSCVLTSLEDITERILLEQQFRHAQKMEAVGQLAAGVAHDFNNLLTVVQAYTGFVLDEATLSESHRAGLINVRTAAERAASLTRQLLLFSRRQIAQPEPLNLSDTFSALRKMLDRLLPAEISLVWRCEPNLPLVQADEANIEQVLMNLVVNARDAMPRGGTLQLAVRTAHLTAADAKRHPDARPGTFVCLTVADTGTGIEPAVLARIFEPFFTTKDVGQGTGLGLSTVYAIARQHDGWIEVASELGRGSTFEVFLPVLKAPPANPENPSRTPPSPAALPGGGERILLVEDEPGVRMVTRVVLTRAGYRVTEASDGPSALQVWATAAEPFNLLITDMVMPNGTTGSELAAFFTERQPGLKVIFTTGYSPELLRQGTGAIPGARVLLKPFVSAQLLTLVREALARSTAPVSSPA